MASKNNFTAIASIIILLLLGLAAFQFYKTNQLSKKLAKTESSYNELEKIQTELEQDYESALASLEEKRGENQELNTLIDQQKEDLRKQKDKINGLIWTKKELSKAREEMSLMNARVSGYLDQINKLKQDNELLSSTNLKLSNENEILTEDVKNTKAAVNRLDSVRVVLVNQTEDLTNENKDLGNKVDLAEAIKLNSIEVQGYSFKSNGDLRSRSRAKNIEVLRSCLSTETNLVTPKGEKEFYIRIVSPSGETLNTTDMEGNVITNKLNGEEVRYTTNGTIAYNQEDTNFCIDWEPATKLSGGNYGIEVFNNGYLVGKGSFDLK